MDLDLEKIKMLRKQKKLSLKNMALELGYETPTGYFYAESGRCNFKPNHLPLMSKKLGVPMEELFLSTEVAKMAK